MWVRFWYNIQGHVEDNWRWFSEKETKESLDELADELVPDYIKYYSDYSYSKGWEKKTPPPRVLEELKKEWQEKLESAEFMLDIIEKTMKYGE